MIRTHFSTLALTLLLGASHGAVAAGEVVGRSGREDSAPAADRQVETTTSEAAHKLAEAHRALLAVGMEEEAAAIERIIKDVGAADDDGRSRGWRWSRGSSGSAKDDDKGHDRVPSEISILFREMFEIHRGVEEHESRVRALRQREQAAATENTTTESGDSARREIARHRRQINEGRGEALQRLRERAPRLRETIDRAIRNIDAQNPDDSAGPRRMKDMRERIVELRETLDHSEGDDDRFYGALREFVENSRFRRPESKEPDAEAPTERVLRIDREVRLLQDRLRELEGERRRLRVGDGVPPPPGSAPRPEPNGPAPGPPPRRN